MPGGESDTGVIGIMGCRGKSSKIEGDGHLTLGILNLRREGREGTYEHKRGRMKTGEEKHTRIPSMA